MPWYDVFWTGGDRGVPLAQHGVTPDEAADVVQNPKGVARSRSSGRMIAFGYTNAGRSLAVVYDAEPDGVTVHLVTAYDVQL